MSKQKQRLVSKEIVDATDEQIAHNRVEAAAMGREMMHQVEADILGAPPTVHVDLNAGAWYWRRAQDTVRCGPFADYGAARDHANDVLGACEFVSSTASKYAGAG